MPLLFVIFFALLAAHPSAQGEQNLVRNAGFEQLAAGQPRSWQFDSYSGDARLSMSDQAHGGSHAVRLQALRPDDVKLIQYIAVEPNARYRISAWVKTSGVGTDQLGANLSTSDIADTSPDLRGTSADWVRLEVYGRTGGEQRLIPLTLRLGGYGRVNLGEAWFDDISVVRVDQIPSGARAIDLFTPESAEHQPGVDTSALSWAEASTLWSFGGAMLFVGVAIFLSGLLRAGRPRAAASLGPLVEPLPAAVWGLLLAALALRVWLAIASPGLPNDIGAFAAWARHAASHALFWSYSDPALFLDYPPGYLYVLFLIGRLSSALGLQTGGEAFLVLLKLPALLAEAGIAWLLFQAARARWGLRGAAAIALLFLLSPAVLINAAAWGQVDAVLTLAIVASLMLLVTRRYGGAGALFALALLIKPQALLWLPVLGLVSAIDSWRERSPRPIAVAGLGFVLAFSLPVLPFALVQGPGWIVELYLNTLGSYPYATLNAFNLYALLGWNWVPIDSSPLTATPWVWGSLFVMPTLVFASLLLIRSRRREVVLYLGALVIAMAFTFMPKMHERYLYAVIPLLLLCFGRSRDRRFLLLAVGYSITVYIGEVTTLLRAWEYEFYGIPNDFLLMRLTALANLVLFAWLAKAGIDLYWQRRPALALAPADHATPMRSVTMVAAGPVGHAPRWCRLDLLLLALLLIPYSTLAYFRLGTLLAPDTYWQPTSLAVVVADLGEPARIRQIDYFLSLGQGEYTVDFSSDREDWHSPVIIQQESLFGPINWRTAAINQNARYIRIQTERPGAMLNELALIDSADNILSPVSIDESGAVAANGAPAAHLFDEPETRPQRAGFLTGTYFDEVYHARTALEHLRLLPHSETTHPPLGKLLIGSGIALFGANPFAWRFMGAAFGILMIAAVYALGLQLFARRRWAFVAAFLLTFDFLHFTQSRIATIDVFTAFFVLLSYWFMLKFHRGDWLRTPGPGRRWLLLSAACFGAALACKWNALFAAPGLLVIFLYSAWKKVSDRAQSQGMHSASGRLRSPWRVWRSLERDSQLAMQQSLGTALMAFNLVTLSIYFAAYIPFLLTPGPGHGFADVVQAQAQMFDYHASITDQSAHPFASPWWQWPLIIKPVWYWLGDTGTPDQAAVIVALGNPAIWWVGMAAALYCAYLALARRDEVAFFLLVAFCSLYLPWALSPRKLTFLYHFLPAVPFTVLMITRAVQDLRERLRLPWFVLAGYLIAVALLFGMFYPVLSGLPVDRQYIDTRLRWLPSWTF